MLLLVYNKDKEVGTLATKSILKSIQIKDKKSAARLASALENASGKKSKAIKYNRSFSDASRDDIRKMFSK